MASRRRKRFVKKTTHIKKETSKIFTTWVLVIVTIFLFWTCYEMTILKDLSALAYVAPSVLIFGAICLRAYCTRAVNKDLAHMTVNNAKELSKLKKEFGDNFIYEEFNPIDFSD